MQNNGSARLRLRRPAVAQIRRGVERDGPDPCEGEDPQAAQTVVDQPQRVSDAVASSREEIERLKAKIAEREERDGARRKRELDERFEREFPGLAAQIGPGGDKAAAWASYRRFNGPSIDAAAMSALRSPVMSWMTFFASITVPTPAVNARRGMDSGGVK